MMPDYQLLIEFLFALIIGLTLGITGGGGSILTIPVLVYIAGINPLTATAYSLVIVGVTAAIGSLTFLRKKLIDLRAAALFAIPSMLIAFITRKFLLPNIPETLLTTGSFTITRSHLIMIVFAVVMISAGIMMIKTSRGNSEVNGKKHSRVSLLSSGILVGLITGITGAGGGFLIVPALSLVCGLSIKTAIGTSLLIITLNSISGFAGDIGHQLFNWHFLILFTLFTIAGVYAGSYINNLLKGKNLKLIFGWFIIIIALFIFGKELFF